MISQLFNPYRNGKCLQWSMDNDEEFQERLIENEMMSMMDAVESYMLGDHLSLHACNGKAEKWASENYDDLEFCLEYNPSWYCNNDELGQWVQYSPSYQQTLTSCDDGFDGIFVGTIGNLGEIEEQAENGDLAYHSGISNGYFKVLARLR